MTACPREPALARAISEGAGPELAAHLDACPACRAGWHGMQRAIELARQVPTAMPSADRREEMRTAILASRARLAPGAGRRGAVRRRGAWLAGGALAAAAAAAIVVSTRPREAVVSPHAHGTVRAREGARYLATSATPDETVVLHDGSIDVEVTPLHAGERFRVVTADTEVEVRGTAFEVTARRGHLIGVRVRHGLVEVRPLGGTIALVRPGEAWTAPSLHTAGTPPAPPVIAEAPAIAAPRRVGSPRPRPPAAVIAEGVVPPPPPSPTPAPRTPSAIAYDEAWAAVRAGDFERASTAFARAGILDPDGPLAEDASYWYAVTLARAKRPEAVTAFRELLDRYPRSAHAREASAMLGWLLVDASERVEAERRFRAAIDDPSPRVRDSARAGLAALGVK